MKQRTLNKSFCLEGKGLHTGLNLKMIFHPAPENHGYKIRRTDIAGQPIIAALAENVSATQRGTILSVDGVSVSTVEHALAALYACEIDNCLIDIDGPEFPIMDGSSITFVSKIKETGIQQQCAERKYLSFPQKKIKVRNEVSGSSLVLLPDDSFSISCRISFDSVFLKQQEAYLPDLFCFASDFAPARTFVFVKELELLLNKNLIKGGDLDNAIVIYDQVMEQDKFDKLSDMLHVKRRNANELGYIMQTPLSSPNEPARHKLLDIVGDIALVGYFIKGKIIADCPGHTINNLFAREIRKNIIIKQKADFMGIAGFYWNQP